MTTPYQHLSATLFERLDTLRPETPALWGSMNAQQMVEHLALPFGLALGNFAVPVAGTPEQVAKRRWHTFENRTPLPKGLRVPFVSENPVPTFYPDMPAAVTALREIVGEFFNAYSENPQKTADHPLLGTLDKALWEDFLWMHCAHHLRQFGLLPEE
jgi:hypothetical protein